MQRIGAHPGENQRVLALEEALGTHATGGTTLGGIHLQRSHLGGAVFGTGQSILIPGHGEHHRARTRSQTVLAFLVGPSHLAGGHHIEGHHMSTLGELDAGHAAGRAALRAHVLRIEGE